MPNATVRGLRRATEILRRWRMQEVKLVAIMIAGPASQPERRVHVRVEGHLRVIVAGDVVASSSGSFMMIPVWLEDAVRIDVEEDQKGTTVIIHFASIAFALADHDPLDSDQHV